MFRKKEWEYVKCPHCDGTGKCKCGMDALKEMNMRRGFLVGWSIKEFIGVKYLCVGVCDSCGGKGWHKREKIKGL